MTKFLLVRHANTDMVGKVLAGRTPAVSLNEEGVEQTKQLVRRLVGLQVAAIYSSPLDRAMETAKPLSELFSLTTVADEHFLELDFGEWTGKTFEELKHDRTFKHFNVFRSATRVPKGELMLEAQARMVAGLEQLKLQHPNQTVIVVSHSDLIKATLAYYAGIHLDMFQRIEISPASVSILEVYDETARITVVNDTGTLLK